jgi:hypothetical protein
MDVSSHEGRLTFSIFIAPLGAAEMPEQFLSVDYELYSIRLLKDHLSIEPPTPAHIVAVSPVKGKYEAPQVGKAWAELHFHQKITGVGVNIFWEKGIYTLLTVVPMMVAPALTIDFIKGGLTVEVIPFEGAAPPTHRLRFYVKDAAGRNRTDDFRPLIDEIKLDARMHQDL